MATHRITETVRYLTFRLGDELFAINVFKAREVLDVSRITRVPTAPAYLRGVVNVRGNAIPVVDLRKKFGLPEAEETRNTRIIVMEIEIEGEQAVVGGLADSVHEVLELEPTDIEAPPALGMRWRTDLILGMGRREEQFLILLDIDKVFTTEELSAIPGGLGAAADSLPLPEH